MTTTYPSSRRRLLAVAVTAGLTAFLAGLAPAPTHAQDTGARRPSPEQCAKRCDENARAMYRRCVASGAAEERCANAARQAAAECKKDCRPAARPPVAVDACHRDCATKAREAHKACIDGGGDAAQCAEDARAQLKACHEACPKPDPAPSVNCEAVCERAAEHAEQRCLAAGGTAERCNAAADAARTQCTTRCARSGERPPNPGVRPGPR